MPRNAQLSDLNSELDIARIEATDSHGTVYVWDARATDLDEIRRTYPDATKRIQVIGNKQRDVIRGGAFDARLFVATVADCAFPPQYFIIADNWEEAYETACDEIELLRISDTDLPDYEEDSLNYTSDGKPIDTECLRIDAVKINRIDLA